MFGELGRTLMILGGLIFVAGLVLTYAGRVPWLGNLPGDVALTRGNFRLYAPFGTMIIVSIILSVLLNLIVRLFR